eukprot:gene16898-21549_t
MMAGLDGVENKIHPGEAATKDLYHLPPEEDKLVPTVCHSLDQALEYLDKGRSFLTKGGVFTDSMLDAYIELKMSEVTRFRMAPHPVEFDMYYSIKRKGQPAKAALFDSFDGVIPARLSLAIVFGAYRDPAAPQYSVLPASPEGQWSRRGGK